MSVSPLSTDAGIKGDSPVPSLLSEPCCFKNLGGKASDFKDFNFSRFSSEVWDRNSSWQWRQNIEEKREGFPFGLGVARFMTEM